MEKKFSSIPTNRISFALQPTPPTGNSTILRARLDAIHKVEKALRQVKPTPFVLADNITLRHAPAFDGHQRAMETAAWRVRRKQCEAIPCGQLSIAVSFRSAPGSTWCAIRQY